MNRSHLFTMGVLGLMCVHGGTLLAASEKFSVHIDKGELTISYDDLVEPYKLVTVIPSGCGATKVDERFVNSVLTISHGGEKCSSGVKASLTISKKFKEIQVNGDAGLIKISPQVLGSVEELKAEVAAGLIKSDKVEGKRLENPAGMKASYKNPAGSLKLNISLKSGLIDL